MLVAASTGLFVCSVCSSVFLDVSIIRMMRWLSTLPTHSYNNEGMMDLQKNKDTNTIEEISANSKEKEKNAGEVSVNPGNEDCAVPSETDSRENEKNEGEESVNLSNEDSTVSSEARTEMVSDT